jgi:hypothetical protein
VIVRGLSAQVPETVSGDSAAGGAFSNSVAHAGCAVFELVQVEPAHDRPVRFDEDVEGAEAGVLFTEQVVVVFWKAVEEPITTVIYRPAEVSAVLKLEGEDRRKMIAG